MNHEIILEATMDNLNVVIAFVENNLEQLECPTKVAMKIAVCVEELFVNIVNYAYEGCQGECSVAVDDLDGTQGAKIIIKDKGVPFNPIEKENPDITLDADKREIGGLGIFMVKSIMDKIYYERNNGNNIIIMEKSW